MSASLWEECEGDTNGGVNGAVVVGHFGKLVNVFDLPVAKGNLAAVSRDTYSQKTLGPPLYDDVAQAEVVSFTSVSPNFTRNSLPHDIIG
jgi:hypothetical protein